MIQKCATEYLIVCDKCGKDYVHHTYTKAQAISVFRENGWKITTNGTYCTECGTKRKEE